MHQEAIIGLTAVIVLGIGAQWLAWRIHQPSILFLLVAGFVAGPLTGLLEPDKLLGHVLFPFVSVSVAIILFEGGLSLQLREIRRVGSVVRNLLSIGVMLTWGLVTVAGVMLAGLSLEIALILGAILTVTGPTVTGPLLRFIRPRGEVGSILKWEGIVVDPIGATLSVLVFEAVLGLDAGLSPGEALIDGASIILRTLLAGGGVGAAAGFALVFILRREWVPDFLHNPVTLMFLGGAYTLSDVFQKEAGLLASVVMGTIIANQKQVGIKHIVEFKENLRVLLISSLFVLLAARLPLEALTGMNTGTLWFLAALLLVVRPAAAFVSAIGSRLSWRERAFMAWMAPRGIVAAAVSSLFSIELAAKGHSGAETLVSLTFAVIAGSVLLYSLTGGPVARLLGVAGGTPQGVLFLGAHYWARQLARLIRDYGIRVVLIDTNEYNIQVARELGLNAYRGNILDDRTTSSLDMEGIGRLLALTPNDEVNSLAALRLQPYFGRSNVFQVSPFQDDERTETGSVPEDLRGRGLFHRDLSFTRIAGVLQNATNLRTDKLKEGQESFDTLMKSHEGRLYPLFLVDDRGRLEIFTTKDTPEPREGQTLISLVRPR
ncbi:MAG: sodium:proton antiporter [Spirochaetales bacterium]|nr:sodium:proton antiporter [Leptospiraceae bacterium]MCP5480009.1 sodium:proton antiporter [Spirochaetales bacterium]MCP5485650.1 sodium:proton antiporter [Spirochaetales bacterium]